MSSPKPLVEEIKASSHGKREKTINPLLNSMSLARKNAFCNAFLKNTDGSTPLSQIERGLLRI
jgi:hypothetical protein